MNKHLCNNSVWGKGLFNLCIFSTAIKLFSCCTSLCVLQTYALYSDCFCIMHSTGKALLIVNSIFQKLWWLNFKLCETTNYHSVVMDLTTTV